MCEFGKACGDFGLRAQSKHGIAAEQGVTAVIQPDGILGFVAPPDNFSGGVNHFDHLIIPQEAHVKPNGYA